MRRWLGNFLLALVSLALMVGVFEVLCRTVVNTGTEYHIEMWKYATTLKRIAADPAMGHEHVPGASARLMDADVTINSRGLRNREVASPKPAGTRRILMLGDSIVFGWGVAQDATLSPVLERHLTDGGQGPVEVINTGVGNYNTAMETAYFFRDGISYEPDVVVLNYFINDAEPTPTYGAVPWIARHSYVYAVLGGAWDGLKRQILGGEDWRTYYARLYDAGAPGWTAAQSAIARLALYCREHNIRLIITDIPELRELKDYPFVAVDEALRKIAADNGVELLNLRPAVEKEDPKALWVTVPDPHPNARAQALMARSLADYLLQNPAPAP